MFLTIGSISIQKHWVAIILAMLVIELILIIWKKKVEADIFSSAMIMFIFIWKLSMIVFQFPFIIKNPLSILYFDGGIKGYYLALIIVLIYTWFKVRKQAIINIHSAIFLALLMFNFYEIILHMLVDGLFWVKAITLFINLLFLLLLFLFGRKEVWNTQLAILFPIIQMLLYSIHDETITSILTYSIFITCLLIMKKGKLD